LKGYRTSEKRATTREGKKTRNVNKEMGKREEKKKVLNDGVKGQDC